MPLSEMHKPAYKAHARSIRANGERHALKWINCPLERADMQELCNQSYDPLLQRVAFRKLSNESAANAILLTCNLDLLRKYKSAKRCA